MQGGAGKGGIQQPMGGGGKGGMNRGPGGNAQNNPGMGQSPMAAFGQMNNTHQGLGSAGSPMQSSPDQPTGQAMVGNPMANWQSMLKGFGGGGGYGSPFNPFDRGGEANVFPGLTTSQRPPISNDTGYGNFLPDSGVNMGGGTPMGNFTPPTPQPQEPIGGYIGGQPAQFHYQAQGLNKPATNNAGLPTGGLLARMFGGG